MPDHVASKPARVPSRPGRCARAWFDGLPALALCVAFAIGLPGGAQAGETITLGAEDDWAPYSSIKADKSGPEGLAPELVRKAFAARGIEVRFETLPFARCMFLAEAGKLAGCFNATIVDDNREVFHWHTTPLFHEELAIFGPVASPRTDLGPADLEGKRVGVTLGYTYPPEIRNNPKIRRVDAKSDGVLLQMLAADRVDYILLNTAPGYMRIKADPKLRGRITRVGVISKDGFWVAFSKRGPDGKRLADTLERGLQDLKANGQYVAMQTQFRLKFGL